MTTAKLKLTRDELLALEAVLTPTEMAGEGFSPDKAACLKIGSALLGSLEFDEEQEVCLTEAELWVFRERISISLQAGANTQLGVQLKKKLYQALLSLAVQEDVQCVTSKYGEMEIEPKWDSSLVEQWAIEQQKEAYDAGKNADTNPDEETGEGTGKGTEAEDQSETDLPGPDKKDS